LDPENKQISFHPASEAEKLWGAELMAGSEPWRTLGVGFPACLGNCTDPAHQVFIISSGDTPSGILIIHPKGLAGSPYIKSIVVAPNFRNQGIGKALMNFAETHARKSSRHLFLCVSSFNADARKFYSRLGYQETGVLKDYLVNGADEILLYKRLQ
jgi:[ribosomal protein S18]-alanine N-acetyltransferase